MPGTVLRYLIIAFNSHSNPLLWSSLPFTEEQTEPWRVEKITPNKIPDLVTQGPGSLSQIPKLWLIPHVMYTSQSHCGHQIQWSPRTWKYLEKGNTSHCPSCCYYCHFFRMSFAKCASLQLPWLGDTGTYQVAEI